MNHTPTPWRVGRHGCIVSDNPDPQLHPSASDAKEYYGGVSLICETVCPTNAAFIVKACNGYDEIHEALMMMRGIFFVGIKKSERGNVLHRIEQRVNEVFDKLESQ